MFESLFKKESNHNNSSSSSSSGKSKKKRKRPPKKKEENNTSSNQKKRPKLKTSEEAIVLSTQLKSLSTQKRFNDALQLYWDTSNDSIRDEYHACIMIDCCSRCGNIQEGIRIVKSLEEEVGKEKINVQTKTALLKGYVHSGMIREASLLYRDMMMVYQQTLKSKIMRKRESSSGPNVRTLNTLLRGCLWSATSCYYHEDCNDHEKNPKATQKYDIHGGVVTSEQIWPDDSNHHTIQPDLSSYEYSIILLCQALRIDEAKDRVKLLESQYGITSTKNTKVGCYEFDTKADPSSLETLAVAYISLARACALLPTKFTLAKMYATTVISLTQQMLNHANSSGSSSIGSSNSNLSNNKNSIKMQGGKRAWKTSSHPSTSTLESSNKHQDQEQQSESRRDVSNKLFRIHRVKEIQTEAKMILHLFENNENGDKKDGTTMKKHDFDLPFYLTSRLLYFSGGGTTDVSALKLGKNDSDNAVQQKKFRYLNNDSTSHLHTLWFSFGLANAMKERYPDMKLNVSLGQRINQNLLKKITDRLNFHVDKLIHDNGNIDFAKVFSLQSKPCQKEPTEERPIYLELGSGFGEWAVYQAKQNPSCDYVAVELRADRVSQMFTKAMLNNSGPLNNICSIGSECGHLLRHRIPNASISKIFINHPEPPTQTFGTNIGILRSIAAGGEEPAHMLNSETLASAVQCLKESTGELVIVTDNRWYAKLICSTLLKVMICNNRHGLSNKVFHGESGITQVDSFYQNVEGSRRQERVNLYEGKPNKAIGHFVQDDNRKGHSYFDRLWKSGAGTHAETQRRFIIVMCKSNAPAPSSTCTTTSNQSQERQIKRKSKKKSIEKQKRRNAKRLLKKQQLQEQQQSHK